MRGTAQVGAPESLIEQFAGAVRDGETEAKRLQYAVDFVVRLVHGCDHASVTVSTKHSLTTAAASDDVVRTADVWQYELNEGPSVDTVRDQCTVISQDLGETTPWLRWAPLVHHRLGVQALITIPLARSSHPGTLNLYANRADTWGDGPATTAEALARYLSMAAADARLIEDRGRAMETRTVIGQAQGILMERYSIDAEAAFAYLRRISQETNRKIVTIAEELVTGR